MPESAPRFDQLDCRTTIFHARAEFDDLYDPPEGPESSEPYLTDAAEESEEFDIYGLIDFDEDDE
jgi:hypothetical protein